ncbi:hypothetical protein DPMN_016641 [Dreissena polymorpha]|uniref:Uncharacterized protein n=1 Tax=Dreissena polymorpha TaxID=45954 RepID=A0A9D4NDG8_DREPO|nr:hypothetical protein DPMN_016641 [Dreissena polymorpha]
MFVLPRMFYDDKPANVPPAPPLRPRLSSRALLNHWTFNYHAFNNIVYARCRSFFTLPGRLPELTSLAPPARETKRAVAHMFVLPRMLYDDKPANVPPAPPLRPRLSSRALSSMHPIQAVSARSSKCLHVSPSHPP